MAKPLQATKLAIAPAPTIESAPVKRGPGRPPGAKSVAGNLPGAVKAPRKGKPTQWSKWGKQALRFAELNKKLDAMVKAAGADAGVLGDLNNNIISDEGLAEISDLVSALQKLDADRIEVPKIPKAPKGPVFVVGDPVKMVKKFRDKYLETGIYTAANLDLLSISAVGKKGLLCQVDGVSAVLQVFVRYPKHLEKR